MQLDSVRELKAEVKGRLAAQVTATALAIRFMIPPVDGFSCADRLIQSRGKEPCQRFV